MNRDVNATRHRATSVGACRGGCHRVGMVGSGRDSGNSGTGGGHKTFTIPSISDVITDEAVEVDVQDNHLALANFHLVGIHLQVRTVGVDVEGLRGGTSTIGSGDRVGTSRRGGEGSTRLFVAPSVGVSIIRIGSSSNRSGSTVANDVVARERELRSSVDGDFVLITVGRSRHRRGAAIFIGSACSEVVLAGFVKRDDHHAVVSTFNHSTVLIPSVGISGITRVASFESDLFTGADIVVANRELRSSRNSVNRDVDRSIDRAVSRSSRHRVSNITRSGRNGRNGGTGGSGEAVARPRVSNRLIVITIDIRIQGNHLTLADLHLVSIDLQVSTESGDFYGSNCMAIDTLNSVHSCNRIDTRNRGSQSSIISAGIIAPIVSKIFSPMLILRSYNSGSDFSIITITDYIVASQSNFGKFINVESESIRKVSAVTTINNSLSSHIVQTMISNVKSQVSKAFTGYLNTVKIPNVIGGIIRIRSGDEVIINTSAKMSVTPLCKLNSRRISNNRIHCNIDRTLHRTLRVARTIGSGNDSVGVTISSNGRDSGNRRTCSRGNRSTSGVVNQTSTRPSVSNIVTHKAVDIGVQDNHLALANFHLVGIRLQVRTVGVDVEGLNRRANLISIGSGNRVGTSCHSLEFITFSLTITPSVGVFSIRINRSSGDRSRSTITDDVVTRERELRSSINGNGLLIRNRRSVATLSDSLHCEGVLTSSKHIDRQVLEVLTRNLNTVHVPNEVRSFDIIITVGLNTSSQVNLSTSADFLFTIILDSGRKGNNRINVNSNRTGNLTSTFLSISRSGDIVNNSTRGSGLSHNCGTS